MSKTITPSDEREESMEKLGELLSEFMMATQSGDRVEIPDFEKLLTKLPGIDQQEIEDAFLAAGVIAEGPGHLPDQQREPDFSPSVSR